MKRNNLEGIVFGRLLVLYGVPHTTKRGKKSIRWVCLCDCGNTTNPKIANKLRSGETKSCGCLRREVTRDRRLVHGCTSKSIYKKFNGMLERCNNPNCKSWEYYGGRGIKVCDNWSSRKKFINFYNWAVENGYEDHLTIERIDVNGNYEPGNCTWITSFNQASNKTTNRHIEYKGKIYTIAQASREFNIIDSTLESRLDRGWTVADALMRPVGKNGKRKPKV